MGTAPATITLARPAVLREAPAGRHAVRRRLHRGQLHETIAGLEVLLGSAIATLSSATVANRAELLDTRPWHADQGPPVRFQPAPGVELEFPLTRGKDSPA
jgi:hypothetical protein